MMMSVDDNDKILKIFFSQTVRCALYAVTHCEKRHDKLNGLQRIWRHTAI